MMKKLVVCLLALVLSFSIFASAIDNLTYKLSSNKMSFVFPSVQFSGFHISEIMKTSAGSTAVANFMHGKITLGEFLDTLVVVLRDTNTGKDSITSLSLGFGYAHKNKALAYDAYVAVDTYAENTASLDNIKLNPAIISSLSFAYAFKPLENDDIVFNLTAVGHVNTLVKNDSVSYQNVVGEEVSLIKGNAGLGFPIDVKTNIDFKAFDLDIDVCVDNLFGYYFTKRYENEGEIKSAIFAIGKDVVKQPFDLNTTFNYTFDLKFVDLTLFTKFNSINSIFVSSEHDYLRRYTDIGFKLSYENIAQLEAGIYNGYFGAAATVGFKNNKFGIRYGWQDMGTYYGQAPTDCLTILFSLGWCK